MTDPDNTAARFTNGALLHLPGIGPKKVEALRGKGVRTWRDLREIHHARLPGIDHNAPPWLDAIHKCEDALAANDLRYLLEKLHRSDHWRVLADYIGQATYLDIETSGDDLLRPEITLIICLHRGRLHIFTADRNLDDFLPLLDEINLLVTFNGASFDVPQMEQHFHIPMNDIPHIDLRWVCYHAGLRGGLKEIERAIGLVRPADLIGMDGGEADWLWKRWKETGNEKLVQRLTRYCAADVIGLGHLSQWLVSSKTNAPSPVFHWHGLPESAGSPYPTETEAGTAKAELFPANTHEDGAQLKRLRDRARAMQSRSAR